MSSGIRVRFAPSPTGPLHIGGVRTALYNYLFARRHGGSFILRIEDTDQARYVPGAEDYIIDSLEWCGLHFDEGVKTGGPFGPYRQSERKPLYKPFADQLVAGGYAYYAFDTPEELEERRRGAGEKGSVFQYDSVTRMSLKNSLVLSSGEVERKLGSGDPYVIRIKIPAGEKVHLTDLVRGDVEVDTATLDDKVLFKSDGMPTYHLANVVDDHLMQISHVIRGEEWLPSAPMHVLLYRFLGWEDSMPRFAHLPLLLKPDGTGKLSKRDGDRLGFPVFPLQWTDPRSGEISSGYRESGYLPQAFVNFLSLLGWNPGTDREIFSMEELTEVFSLDRVSKSGAKFDFEKGRWFNQQYILQHDSRFLLPYLLKELKSRDISANDEFNSHVCSLVRERIVLLSELWEQCVFFYVEPLNWDREVVDRKFKPGSTALLGALSAAMDQMDFGSPQQLEDSVKAFLEAHSVNTGQVLFPLRYAITGRQGGPGMFDIMSLLGPGTCISRINRFLNMIN